MTKPSRKPKVEQMEVSKASSKLNRSLKSKAKLAPKRLKRKARYVPFITEVELARLGGGQLAYIRELTPIEAQHMFPTVEGLPNGINLFALLGADGMPIALTDSRMAAVGHAHDDELQVAAVH